MRRCSKLLRIACFGLLLPVMVVTGAIASVEAGTPPSGAPPELKVAFFDFLSGPGGTLGTVAKNAAAWLVDNWNSKGGIRGVRIKLFVVDEAGGADKQVTEFRRLALDEKVEAVVGYTSSASCLAIAPVAEELRILMVAHTCASYRLTEGKRWTYVFRAGNSSIADSIIGVRYLLATKPDLKSIAGVNFDYAYGRDSWEEFKTAMLRLKPGVRVVEELWTKFQAVDYSAEISKLLTAKPDAIHTINWGGGAIALVNQAAPRGLFKNRTIFFSRGDHFLQDLKHGMPEGIVVNSYVGGYFLSPDPERNPLQKEFLEGLRARFGRYPDSGAYRAYQALAGLRAAYEKAIDQGGGRWPTTADVATAFGGLTWQTPVGPVTMRSDHEAVHGQIIGITKFSPKLGFALMDRIKAFPAEELVPPAGVRRSDWLQALK